MKQWFTYIFAAVIGLLSGHSFHSYSRPSQTEGAVDNPDGLSLTRAHETDSIEGESIYHNCLDLLARGVHDLDFRSALAFLSQQDPKLSLEFVKHHVLRSEDRDKLQALCYSVWAAADSDAAIDFASNLDEGSDAALGMLSRALRKSDPRRAALIDFRHEASKKDIGTFWDRVSDDPVGVGTLLNDEAFKKIRTDVRTALLERVAESKYYQDADQAFQWAADLRLPKAREESLAVLVEKMAKVDPQKALARLQAIPQWQNQISAMEALARSWHQTDAEAAMQWLGQNLYGDERSRALQQMLNDTLASDPALAARQAVDLTHQGKSYFANFTRIVGRYAQQSPREALDWVENLSPELKVNRASAAAEIAMSWSSADPEAAKRAWRSMGDPALAAGFAKGLGETLGKTNPTAALSLLEELDEDQYNANAPYALGGYAENDPVAASTLVTDIEDSSARSKAAAMVARQWASSEPVEAGNWASTLEDPAVQAAAIGQVVRSWARVDPNAAAEWVSTFPQGAATDAAAAEIAHAVVIADPEAAFQWAVAIEDPGSQWRTLPSIVASWASRDANAALQAVSTAPLLPEQVDGLNDLVQNVSP